ncbi:MAG: flagellar hook-length control protein FliK [Clostridiales bacterium]|jgi:flagellar hook-length control protein FliK|nr:flagellar hook-length control protein FliK [Clostridiales bacterium]
MEVQKAQFELTGTPLGKNKSKTGNFLPFLEKAAQPAPTKIKKGETLAAIRPQAKKNPDKPNKAGQDKGAEKSLDSVKEKTMSEEAETQQEALDDGAEAKETEEDPCKAVFVNATPIEPQFIAIEAVLSFFGASAEILPETDSLEEAPAEAINVAPAPKIALPIEMPEEQVLEDTPIIDLIEPRLLVEKEQPLKKPEGLNPSPEPEELTQSLSVAVSQILNSRESAPEPIPQAFIIEEAASVAAIQETLTDTKDSSSQSEPDLGEASKAAQAMALPFAEKAQAAEAFVVPRIEVAPADIARQIMGRATVRETSPGVSEARIALHPESLGEVVLSVKSDNGVITANFAAADPRVSAVIEESLTQLKAALADQGLGVSQLSVSVGGERQPQPQQEERRRQGRYYGAEEKSDPAPEAITQGISGKTMDLAI